MTKEYDQFWGEGTCEGPGKTLEVVQNSCQGYLRNVEVFFLKDFSTWRFKWPKLNFNCSSSGAKQ